MNYVPIELENPLGLEPRTYWIKASCSKPTELRVHIKNFFLLYTSLFYRLYHSLCFSTYMLAIACRSYHKQALSYLSCCLPSVHQYDPLLKGSAYPSILSLYKFHIDALFFLVNIFV